MYKIYIPVKVMSQLGKTSKNKKWKKTPKSIQVTLHKME